jgi:hypothetical protein
VSISYTGRWSAREDRGPAARARLCFSHRRDAAARAASCQAVGGTPECREHPMPAGGWAAPFGA